MGIVLKKTVVGLSLLMLIFSLSVMSDVQPANASGTIYIRADASIDPPDAPISTFDNVTYTLTGNITSEADGIVVEKDNIVVDGSGFAVEGNANYGTHGIYLHGRSNVTIQNTNIKNFSCGIFLYTSANNRIYGNNITNNDLHGIWLNSSSNYNSLSGNNIANNYNDGVMLYGSSDYNSIEGNNITDSYYGIYLGYSLNNSINKNNITNSYLSGIGLVSSSNNSINGNNLANNEYSIELYSSNYNSISENTITNNVCGIWLHSSSNNNSVSGNTFTGDGLNVWDSYSNIVEDNTVNGRPLVYLEGVADFSVEDAAQVVLVRCNRIKVENLNLSRASFGVEFWETNNSIVSGNNITANSGYPIELVYSCNNSISGNIMTNNSDGLFLHGSSNNSIDGNRITANNDRGIGLSESSNYNSVSGNNITESVIGIWLYFCSNNTVCHNNFINNTVQVEDLTTAYANSWDNGCEGNYWSNYNGTDADDDGVGNTYLPWEGKDNYPLMNVYWNPCDINHDLEVNRTDILVSATAFSTRLGDTLWNPHADITGPEPLVPDGKVDMRDISLIAKHYGEHI